ncbi:MAG: ParB/RepB/Spo0J family partition protein [Chitinispirillaceae bacterium]|nr:ParB/RepB/Spo0J family partition protein [Chitinispirillaceae bacterium]
MNKKGPRRVLGRGLSALIPVTTIDGAAAEQEIVDIDYAAIKPNPFQPRTDINGDEIKELADSIKVQGLLQPVLVRQKSNSEFEIVSGERRFRALRMLGRDRIPCIIKHKLSDREMMEIALVENIQREDLNEIDKAEAFHKLIDEHDYTHEALSRQIGKSRASITNTLRLRSLPQEIQQMLKKKLLSMGHARALLGIQENRQRIALANKIINEEMTVRATENKVQQDSFEKKGRQIKTVQHKNVDPNIADAISRLRYKLGTQVTVKTKKGNQGTIEIDFFSEKDFARIIELLLEGNTR